MHNSRTTTLHCKKTQWDPVGMVEIKHEKQGGSKNRMITQSKYPMFLLKRYIKHKWDMSLSTALGNTA